MERADAFGCLGFGLSKNAGHLFLVRRTDSDLTALKDSDVAILCAKKLYVDYMHELSTPGESLVRKKRRYLPQPWQLFECGRAKREENVRT